MTSRRDALAMLAGVAAAACSGSRASQPPAQASAPTFKLDPIADLVPAAGLVWLVEARARDLFASADLIPAIALVAPEDRLDAFAVRHGGVDLRRVEAIAVAGYERATLAVARGLVDPARVEGAFAARATAVDGRAIDREGVTRFWGTVGAEREQVAVFGRAGVAIERGFFGPLRAATYFAEAKLKRAMPALRADPLARAAQLAGDAPLRAFAPGPFAGEWAAGLGGLLRATTAVAAAARPRAHAPNGALDVTFFLTGAWGDDAAAAADRLLSAFGVLAADPLGRLAAVDRPLDGPRASATPDALRLDVSLDPLALARGLRAATDAGAAEIMSY